VFSAIEAAAKACLAAKTGSQTLWRQARAQRDDVLDADLDCLQAWSPGRGQLVVLPDDGSIRLVFGPGR
jgi:predicted RNase H-like nuclease